MNAEAVLANLLARGIEPSLTADETSIVLPVPSIDPATRQAILNCKPELIERIRESTRITSKLLAAAMRACDVYGDDEAARQAMRADVLATPPELRAGLLEHFTRTYGPAPQEPEQPPAPATPATAKSSDWKPLHTAYMRHAQNCPTCQSAGRGYGQRCTTGLSLWATYTAAVQPAAAAPERRAR